MQNLYICWCKVERKTEGTHSSRLMRTAKSVSLTMLSSIWISHMSLTFTALLYFSLLGAVVGSGTTTSSVNKIFSNISNYVLPLNTKQPFLTSLLAGASDTCPDGTVCGSGTNCVYYDGDYICESNNGQAAPCEGHGLCGVDGWSYCWYHCNIPSK